MLSIEMAGYAALPGLLVLAAAVLIVPDMHRSIDLSPPIFSRHFFSASALSVSSLFLLILIFLEPGLLSIVFLAGVFSTLLFLFFSSALFKSATNPFTPGDERTLGWSLGLAGSGQVLAVVGIYLALCDWEDVFILNTFAFGAACVLVLVSLRSVSGAEGNANLKPVVSAADFYVSSLCVLTAAMTMGAFMTESQQVWIGMPVLFVIVGLMVFLAAALLIRADKRGRYCSYFSIGVIAILSSVIALYVIQGELTRKISADMVAGLGMLDRMGPFWASMTGVLTGVLLISLSRHAKTPSGLDRGNLTFSFFLYFIAVGVWISYLFADLYGIAFAGMGLLGTAGLPACRHLIRSATEDFEKERGFLLVVSAFSTIVLVAACLMQVREAVNFEEVFSSIHGILIFAGLALGAGMVYAMKLFLKKSLILEPGGDDTRSSFRSTLVPCSGFILIPVLIGSIGGAETLSGFLPGMALLGFYEIFRMNMKDQSKDAGRLNNLIRLSVLTVLVAAPIVL